jgi:hypothetical protein
MDVFLRSLKQVRGTRRSSSAGSRRPLAAWVQQLERRDLLSLTGISALVNFTAGASPPSTVVIGSFLDSQTTESLADFAASINWGDQSTSAGSLASSPEVPGRFDVSGSHVYVAPGTYQVTITVQSNQGQSLTIMSTAVVSPAQVLGFTGDLAPFPANGPGASSGATNTNRPTFSGTAAPFSTIELFARPATIDVNNPLGYAIASSSGQWILTVGPLAEGAYTVTAVVTPPGGYPSLPQAIANNGQVVIDTTPPRVVRVDYTGGNQVTVFFQDDLSGINKASLLQASNYALAGPRFGSLHPSFITLMSAGSPTDVQEVVLTGPRGRRALSSIRALSVTGTNVRYNPSGTPFNLGITDNAGNPLLGFSQGLLSLSRGRGSHGRSQPRLIRGHR